MEEVWIEIEGAKGYFVSSNGRVRGLTKIMNLAISKKGYPTCRIPNRNYSKPLARTVAIAFIPNPHNLPQVNHKNGNKLNNRIENLEWCTVKQNINHAIDTGLRDRKINLQSNAMFDTFQVKAIKHALKEGFKGRMIAKYFSCDESTISKINVGVHYPNVSI